jgi:hypothetical protein
VTLQKQAGSTVDTLVTLLQHSADGIASWLMRKDKQISSWLMELWPSKAEQFSDETIEVLGNEHVGTSSTSADVAAAAAEEEEEESSTLRPTTSGCCCCSFVFSTGYTTTPPARPTSTASSPPATNITLIISATTTNIKARISRAPNLMLLVFLIITASAFIFSLFQQLKLALEAFSLLQLHTSAAKNNRSPAPAAAHS